MTEPTDATTEPTVEAPAGDETAPPVKAARKRAPRKRAVKKVAAPAATELDAAEPGDSPADTAAPTLAAAAPALTPVEQPAEPPAPAAGEVDPGEASAAAEQPPLEPAALFPEPTDEPSEELDDEDAAPSEPVAAQAAVLFQPPAPTRRRRRAATAPAGPPAPHEPSDSATPATSAEVAGSGTGSPAADTPDAAVAPAIDSGSAAASGDEPVATRPARRTRAPRRVPAVTFGAPDPEAFAPAATAAPAADPTGDIGDTGDTGDTGDSVAPSDGRSDELAPDASAERDADLETDDPARDDQANDDDSGPGRNRRRRGRRGRGRRAGADDETLTDDDAATDTSGADDAQPTGDAAATGELDDATRDDAGEDADDEQDDESADAEGGGSSRRRRRRRRRGGGGGGGDAAVEDGEDPPNTVLHLREPREKGERSSKADRSDRSDGGDAGGRRRRGERATDADDDGVRGVRGSTRLEAKRQRRRDGRDTGKRRAPILSEAEFLARREAVERVMAIRQRGERTQIGVLEDGVLVEHYVTRASTTSYVGNVYLGRVQNVLPSMEAAFIDIGKGRNGVLYAGEVNWDAAGLDGKSRHIEHALHSGDPVLVQVTKDPVGHKGARLTSQVSLPGRYLVYVPGGGMTGISRRLPDVERSRLKAILKKIVPEDGGVIVRTAAEGASEEDLARDVERLVAQWESIQKKATKKSSAPELVHGEPDLAIRVVRDVFNEDVGSLLVQGEDAYTEVSGYLTDMAPELLDRLSRYTGTGDLFHDLRVDEQLAKALDRKVYLPSGGSLVIDRTEAMTVVDVNTGKYIGSGGNLEETVTRNNLEAAEEIVRQLRLRDVGGIVVIDFIDMVLESNRDLVLKRLTECLGRDRTKHQVAEVTSLGLVQMTRKRVGEGLLEAFSTTCECCHGRGVHVSSDPVDQPSGGTSDDLDSGNGGGRKRRGRGGHGGSGDSGPGDSGAGEEVPLDVPKVPVDEDKRRAAATAMAAMARTAAGEAGPVGDLAREIGADALVDTVEVAVAEVDPAAAPAVGAAGADAPVTDVPVTDVPVTDGPATDGPVTDVPVTDGPSPDTGVAEGAEADPTAEAAPPAKKAAPRRRRAARRPAGAPETTDGAAAEAGTA